MRKMQVYICSKEQMEDRMSENIEILKYSEKNKKIKKRRKPM